MNDTLFRIFAALIFLVMLGISGYYRRRADRISGEKVSYKEEGPVMTLALRLAGFSLWLSVIAFLVYPSWIAWARMNLPEWVRWVGVGMGITADFLAYWVLSCLGTNVTPTVATRKTSTLVTSGPYRWVRHPLYTMGLIAFLGFAFIAESGLIVLLGLISYAILAIRTGKEEANLIERFGDEYRTYMKRTGRYLPIW